MNDRRPTPAALALVAGSLCVTLLSPGAALAEAPDAPAPLEGVVAKRFGDLGGCFLLEEQDGRLKEAGAPLSVRWGGKECRAQLPPCSTFKVLSSLTALDAELATPDTKFAWDGRARTFRSWNRDHTLRSAFEHSVVWVYQGLATRIGRSRFDAVLAKLGLGPLEPSAGLTTFWLDGALTISAEQLLGLMRKLVHGELPFSPQSQRTVLGWMQRPVGPEATFGGKTGTCLMDGRLQVGWYVGQVRAGERSFVFATLVRADDGAKGAVARRLTRSILADFGLVPPAS